MADSLIQAASGAAGGIIAMAATYPLIFISTRAAVETKRQNKSTYQAVWEIVEREGLSGLYSGLSSSLLGIAVTNGVYYFFYEGTKKAIIERRNGTKALTVLEAMLAGLIAGSATTIISNPIWVVQTSQAVRTLPVEGSSSNATGHIKRLGFIATLQYIVRKDGMGSLWRGVGPALVLVINPILQYTLFEQFKNFLVASRTIRRKAQNLSGVAVLSDLDFFWLGALSKALATSGTYPYIVIKSRLQAGHGTAEQYSSSLDGIISVIRDEGIGALYRGFSSKLVQSVLTAAILFASQRRLYELTKKVLAPVASH